MQVERIYEQSYMSGERVSNVWITCLKPRDNGWKRPLIPDVIDCGITILLMLGTWKRALRLERGP